MGSEFAGVWIVATCAGKAYIGKVTEVLGDYPKSAELTEITQREILGAKNVCLSPAYDFFSPLRPVQVAPGQLGYNRDPICMPLDFTMGEAKIWIQPSAIVFFEDLEKDDRAVYESFVRAADEQKATQRAAQRSNLTLVDATGKPKHPGR